MDDSYNSYSRKQLDDLFLKMIAYYGGVMMTDQITDSLYQIIFKTKF